MRGWYLILIVAAGVHCIAAQATAREYIAKGHDLSVNGACREAIEDYTKAIALERKNS